MNRPQAQLGPSELTLHIFGRGHFMVDRSTPRFATAIVEQAPANRVLFCRSCKSVSYNPSDVRHRYCGRCHEFLDDRRPLEEVIA